MPKPKTETMPNLDSRILISIRKFSSNVAEILFTLTKSFWKRLQDAQTSEKYLGNYLLCRSWQAPSNEQMVRAIGIDPAENEPLQLPLRDSSISDSEFDSEGFRTPRDVSTALSGTQDCTHRMSGDPTPKRYANAEQQVRSSTA